MLQSSLCLRRLKSFLPIALILVFSSIANGQQPLVVFLVRHAEKVDNRQTSELSAAGKTRAQTLATTLRDAEIDAVHSTDFVRTRKSALPLANQRGVEVELYDGNDLAKLVEKLKRDGGRHLVVGHSNTTPALVELLGGKPGPRIQETEYDRLYIVTIGGDGEVSTVLVRYGSLFDDKAKK